MIDVNDPIASDGTHPNLRQMDDSEFADDFGEYDFGPWYLTEDEEAYRAAAYAAVLHYARDYGLAILPVWWMKDEQTCACVQGSLCDPKSMGKHPVDLRWPEEASDDPEHAARWWRPPEPDQTFQIDWRPRSNVGIAMRGKHFITDIDVDAGKQGNASLERLIDEHGGQQMPPTLGWQTGGGGRQRITLVPEGVDVRNSTSEIAPDIDIRGFNGYGIAPPSVSAKGPYIMLTDVSPDAPCPEWEADWLRSKHDKRTEHIRSHPCGDPRQIPKDGLTKRSHAYITSAFKDAVSKVATTDEGNRNQALNDETFDLFSKFVAAGLLSFDDVAAAMQEAGESCGLPSGAVYKTINSAWDGSQRKDRTSELPDFLFEEPGHEDRDRSGDRILPHPGQPIKTARVLECSDFATEQGLPSLRWHRGCFTRWDGSAWLDEPDSAVEQQLYLITEHAKYEEKEGGKDEGETVVKVCSWNPSPSSITPLMKILGVAVLQLPHRLDPPFWITAGTEERELIPLGNGLLNARTRELSPHTPDYYNSWSLPYDFDPDAGKPTEWLKFLADLWPDEPDSISFLQELCGYLVGGETDMEKVALLHGAKRGGKGTVVRVLTAMMGAMNVTTPTFGSLTGTFGLEPLLGKPLAVISDMRVGGRNIQAAIEILLTISGRDRSTVHRKNRSALEVQLPTRFVLVSNELYALPDAASALVSRTVPLKFTKSWLGKEDRGLGARLTKPEELSRILNWALDGLDRLRKNGKFTMPAGAEETLTELEGLASPETAWAQENCDLGPTYSDKPETLYMNFGAWASDQGIQVIPKLSVFAKNLRAAHPGLVVVRLAADKGGNRPRVYQGIRVRPPKVSANGEVAAVPGVNQWGSKAPRLRSRVGPG